MSLSISSISGIVPAGGVQSTTTVASPSKNGSSFASAAGGCDSVRRTARPAGQQDNPELPERRWRGTPQRRARRAARVSGLRPRDAGAEQDCVRLPGSHEDADIAADSAESWTSSENYLGSLSPRQIAGICRAHRSCAAGFLYSLLHWRKEAISRPSTPAWPRRIPRPSFRRLKESGADYRLSETGDVISVPSAKLAELRLQLAAAGLAANRPHWLRNLRQDQSRRYGVRGARQLRPRAGRRTGAIGWRAERSRTGARAHHVPEGFGFRRIAPARQSQRHGEAPARRASPAAQRHRRRRTW